MLFPDRVYGIETEFGIILRNQDGEILSSPDHQLITRLFDHAMNTFPNGIYSAASSWKIWHPNGGCTYIDTGEHPEHATPECRSVRDAVLYAKAGEHIAAGMFAEEFDGIRINLFRNNAGCNEFGEAEMGFGCHENYLLYNFSAQDETMTAPFIPFLVTRQILDGAGWWQINNEYLYSVRSLYITGAFAGTTTSKRGLIYVKNMAASPHANRLHLICGDANILETAAYLKMGITALVLAMIEAHQCPQPICADTVRSIRMSASMHATLEKSEQFLYRGTIMSAWDVQTLYLEAAREHLAHGTFKSEKTEAELKHIHSLWEATLNAIYRRDEEWMRGRLDWATKKYLIDRHIAGKKLSDTDAWRLKKDMDIMYHDVSNRSLQEQMNKKWADRRLLTDREIRDAIYVPPADTRAAMRGRFVSMILNARYPRKVNVSWTHVSEYEYPYSPELRYDMVSPLICKDVLFEQYFKRLILRYSTP